MAVVLSTKGKPTRYPGLLVDAEGIDGSGKTTALTYLYEKLKREGYDVEWTDWSDSKLAGKALKKGKKKRRMTPLTFATLQAANIYDRLEYQIMPALKRGAIVIADRYFYTSLARDAVRGCDRKWLRTLYQNAPEADVCVWFKIDVDVAMKRKLDMGEEIQYYEAGEDMYPQLDRQSGFLKFQTLVSKEYERIADEYGLEVVDADQTIPQIESYVDDLVERFVRGEVKKAA